MRFDVAVIGCGPAGLQAAIHASRAKVSVALIGKTANSAAAGTSIENYFGVGEASGDDLLSAGLAQAESFGAAVFPVNVTSASAADGGFALELEDGTSVEASAVVLATGVSRVKLGVPGEKELFGKGVSYCASCDCNFYRGRRVVIVGGETEAAVSAELMTRYASKTYWVWDGVRASEAAVRRAVDAGAETVAAMPARILGGDRVTGVELSDGTVIEADGVFIELGARSSADLAMDLGAMPEMDDSVKVDASCATGVPGLFACGDVTGRPWQVARAVGQGCVAGTSAARYAKEARP